MSTPHHSSDHPAPETDHTTADHASHGAPRELRRGQAMHHGHPLCLDEDHQVHGLANTPRAAPQCFRTLRWSLVVHSRRYFQPHGRPPAATPSRHWITWVPPVLDTIIFVWRNAFHQERMEGVNPANRVMLLIAMAITVAFVASWVTTLGAGRFDLDFWWELACW